MRKEESRLILAGRYLGLNPVKKAILLSLTGFGNKPKFPSKQYLAQELLCSTATIRRAKTELIRAGLVTIKKRGKSGLRQSDLWFIDGFIAAADEVLGLLKERKRYGDRQELVRIIDQRLDEIEQRYADCSVRSGAAKVIPFPRAPSQIDAPPESN